MPVETHAVQCPYCGETIEVDLEVLEEEQTFIEDCAVCCRPIEYTVAPGEDGPDISAARSDG